MWWPDNRARRLCGLLATFAVAGLVAGCFQPLYGSRSPFGGSKVASALSSVDVAPIDVPQGTRLSRVGVQVRDNLLSQLNGGGGVSATHRLKIELNSTRLQVIVDIDTARPDIQNYGIDANYSLVDLATDKAVIAGQTFARVSYDIPGQQQRFASDRGLRDAENRAAKVIADQIRSRLASYFTSGT